MYENKIRCCWHGCPSCYNDEDMLTTGRPAREDRKRLEQRIEGLENMGHKVHSIWTCEIEKKLEENKKMNEFFERCMDTGPIRLRDEAFHGGK